MANLSTTFLGLNLQSPVLVGASPISKRIENIQAAEEAGTAGVVIYSLFQEQIELERLVLDEALNVGSESFPEAITYFPRMEHAGPREHIMWVEKTRKHVKFPLIGSLNAASVGNWVDYAKQLENAGCDALELNLYALQTDPEKNSEQIEQEHLDVISSVKSKVSIPVAVKLSPFYTALANFSRRAVSAGADGLVLFNRFYQPFIDTDREKWLDEVTYSLPQEQRLPVRWIAILSGALETDIAATTGVYSGKDAVRYILAGAKVVQTASALLERGVAHVAQINAEIVAWMEAKGYSSLDDFRGKLSLRTVADQFMLERVHYLGVLHSWQH